MSVQPINLLKYIEMHCKQAKYQIIVLKYRLLKW